MGGLVTGRGGGSYTPAPRGARGEAGAAGGSPPRPPAMLRRAGRGARGPGAAGRARARPARAPARGGGGGGGGPGAVVGVGAVCVDFLARVGRFPRPDEKLRTEGPLETQGGGNCGNALCAAARLGTAPRIVTKVGADTAGAAIRGGLEAEGVDTGCIAVGGPCSPSSYIIVSGGDGTRTIIHTPGEEMRPDELELGAALEGATLVYSDGRQPEVALALVREARARGVPVLVEAERLRPGLDALLALADCVVCSREFPCAWTGHTSLGDALVELAWRLPLCERVFATRGSDGCVMLELVRDAGARGAAGPERPLSDILDALKRSARRLEPPAELAFKAAGALRIVPPPVASSGEDPVLVGLTTSGSGRTARRAADARARTAAYDEAALNADGGNSREYTFSGPGGGPEGSGPGTLEARVFCAPAASLPPQGVVDTTGAGDAFIGSLLYFWSTLGWGAPRAPERALQLASSVAAAKCCDTGARAGLPRAADLPEGLLGGTLP